MKDLKYILYVGSAFALFVIVKLMAPKQYDWTVTFDKTDKNPYGAYAFNELIPDIFGSHVSHSYQTIYELKDSLKPDDNLLIIATSFTPEKADVAALLEFVSAGGNAFISAQNFSGDIIDTLNVKTNDDFLAANSWMTRDTSWLTFTNPRLHMDQYYYFQRNNIYSYFDVDTTGVSAFAMNDKNQPVSVLMKIGKGSLVLNSTPMAFTNIYLLSDNNHEYVSTNLSYLPPSKTYWTGYYHLGRMESASPLRFILTNEPLAWAYYITIFSILLFMVFEAKRKQRIIPVIRPLLNKTLEFVTTIGNLYFHKANHKDLATKKITFLMEHIRSRHLIATQQMDDQFVRTLSLKSGHSEEEVRVLINTISLIRQTPAISEDQLMDLNRKIDKFYKTDPA